jgi:hypothetical protein
VQQQYPPGSFANNPYASPTAGAQYPQAQPGYEFGPQENEVFAGTGGWMMFVGIAQTIIGLLALLATIGVYTQAQQRASRYQSYGYGGYPRYGSYYSSPPPDNSAGVLIGGLIGTALIFLLAVFTIRAASGFRTVANTSGNDVPNLMHAMRNLRALYRTIGIVIIVYIVLIVLGIVAMAARAR